MACKVLVGRGNRFHRRLGLIVEVRLRVTVGAAYQGTGSWQGSVSKKETGPCSVQEEFRRI